MVFTQRKTPARLASPAARKLPRQYLFWFMLIYIIAGLFGRDPWKTDDVAGIASMASAINHDNWLTSYIGIMPYTDHGPLTSIIGGAFLAIFSPLFELFTTPLNAHIIAARLPNFLYFFGMMWGVWYGTYLLARRDEAQPLPLPFGGEPHPRDYGRMLADVAFFFMLSSVGIVIRIHETSFFPLLMCIHAIAFYGFVRLLDHPTQGSLVIGLMLVAALMTQGLIGVVPLLIVTIALFIAPIYSIRLKVFLFLSLVLGVLLSAVWLSTAYNHDPSWILHWWKEQQIAFSLQHWSEIPKSLRDLAWFLWPSWPFALLALWNWRKWFDAPHIFIPTIFVIAHLLVIFSARDAFEPEYGPLTIASAILAAMAIPTLKRHIINLLDWYSIMIVTLGLLTIWVGWSALYLGIPAQIQRNIMRLIHGFDNSINWIAVVAGLIVCVLWYKVIAWRLKANPQAMWRGIVLSAAGTIISWLLLSVLWLSAIDYNRSYRSTGESLAESLKRHAPTYECVTGINVGKGQAAAFYVFANLRLSKQKHCRYVLIQTTEDSVAQESFAHKDDGKVIWQGQRPAERHGEVFLLIDLDEN